MKNVMENLLSMTQAEYDAIDAARASFLKRLLISPLHAMTPIEQTPAMARGAMIHDILLQPNLFENYVVSPKFDRRTKEGKAAAQDFEASNYGKTIIDSEEYQTVENCIKSVWSHPAALEYLSNGRAELTSVWYDVETNVKCKARPDFVPTSGGVLVELKTTLSAAPFSFAKTVANLKYHLQAAFYLDGVTHVTGVQFEKFIIVAVETQAPYATAVYELDFGTIEKGRELYKDALFKYAQCRTLQEWPGYSTEVQPLAIPSWAFEVES